jgi:3-methyl-2-oxobutanoate hydroxymethyltransferase
MNTQVTINTLQAMKARGEKIACLTAYDASFAARVDEAGVDVVLVGDSLGMVVQGEATTLPVQMEDVIYHTCAVARGLKRALLIADMPFMSYATLDRALTNAARLVQEGGAQMVKLEGGADQVETVRALTRNNIPVCAHLGLQPQSIHRIGGYRVQGREQDAAAQMLADAKALQDAGASLLVVECIPTTLAADLSKALQIPVIGIGAGVEVDGQVLVLYDMLGITPGNVPRFAKDFLTGETGGVPAALRAYVEAVRNKTFPAAEHTFA